MFVIKNEKNATASFRFRFERLSEACSAARRHGVTRVFWENDHIRNKESRYYGDVLLHGSIADLERKAAARDYSWDDMFDGFEPPVVAEIDMFNL